MQTPVASSPDSLRVAPGSAARATVDFFEAEARASTRAWRYFALFLPCALLMVVAICVWVGVVLLTWARLPPEMLARVAGEPLWHRLFLVPADVYGVTALVVAAIVCGACARRMWQMKQGGRAFAKSLGARAVDRDRPWPQEVPFIHAADEMAVAAGLLSPSLHVLDNEPGINAFAVGWQRDDIAVLVTRGAVERLSREQLQALMAYVLGRVANGDVELNARLIGWLAGLTAIAQFCLIAIMMPLKAIPHLPSSDGDGNDVVGALFVMLLYLAMLLLIVTSTVVLIAGIGVVLSRGIRALGARQRVLLADATALQLTRNQDAVRSLLRSMQSGFSPGRLAGRYREEVGPLLFLPGMRWQCLRTHPSLARRIAAVTPA